MTRKVPGTKGAALILVIWALTVLGIIFSEFLYGSRTTLMMTRNQKLESTGYYLAMAAFNMAVDEINRDYLYCLPVNDREVLFVRKGDITGQEAPQAVRSGTLGGFGKYAYQIIDEESKMNLNSAKRGQLVALFGTIGMSPGEERDSIVDSILDWRDANDLHRLNGAEDDYYQSLEPPYIAKNSRFGTVEELLLVRGMNRQLFYGLKHDEMRALADMFTVYGERINYNTAPPEILTSMLGSGAAENIVRQRQVTPYKDSAGQSSHFTIIAQGFPVGGTTVRAIKAVVSRNVTSQTTGVDILEWNDQFIRAPKEPSHESE